jgi:hypothetical protein
MTAMGTSKSGYIQRRIVKCLEDMQIQYDGTVRNTSGFIYQTAYGHDGMDTKHSIKVKDDISEICDISRMVERLNMEHEIKDEKEDTDIQDVILEENREVVEEPVKKKKASENKKVEKVAEEPVKKKKASENKKVEEPVKAVQEKKEVEKPKKKKTVK